MCCEGGFDGGSLRALRPSGRATAVVRRGAAAAARSGGRWRGDEERIQVSSPRRRTRRAPGACLARFGDRLRDAGPRRLAAESTGRPLGEIGGGQRTQQLL